MRVALISVLLGLLLSAKPAELRAWGRSGHQIVGQLAQARLDPKAQAAVAELLQGEADTTLAGVSIWADEVRESAPEYRWTMPLHWVNFQPGSCHYDAEQVCAKGLCVVAAIDKYSAEMADTKLPLAQRRDALKFVVHFVGDVHQPLHAGYAADRGGNDYQVNIQREGWNLHSVWDSLIIDSARLEWPVYGHRIAAVPFSAESQAELAHSGSAEWAEESCQIVQRDDFYPPKHKITGRYLESKRELADQRLKLAGERLAQLLNRVLGDGAAPSY
jgi:nuclease S1